MAKPTTRQEFKEFVMRKIGAPVIQINVSDEQIEDRIDEAFSFWNDYHYNGSELIYLKHQITEEDKTNQFIPVPADLHGLTKVFELGSSFTGSGMFSAQYQFALSSIGDISKYDMSHYVMSMQHMRLIQEYLSGMPIIRYNKHRNQLHIDVNWNSIPVGSYILFEAYEAITGEKYPDAYQDRWLQNYAAALVKEQWGTNITKFQNMQLVGGVSFNGEQILNDAREERRKMEEECITSLQPLVHNFYG
tara:strand:- start:209 stop:949 length:741 start_codon:yes stop_codon:yes gene_type:complete